MRLLYLSNLRLPTEKAYGIQVAEMCSAFADIGFEVLLAYPYRKNPNKDFFSYYGINENFKIKVIPAVDFYLPGILDKMTVFIKNVISALGLAAYSLKQEADIIYSRDELPLYFLSFFKKNLVFEAHRFSSKRMVFYNRFKKIGIKIIVISEAIKMDMIKEGFDPNNVLVASDGVNLDEFDIDISKTDARKKLYSELHKEAFERKKIAIYVGQLFPWKGVSIFSETAKHLCGKNENYLLFIFGGTEIKDIALLKEELKNIEDKMHPNLVPIFFGYRFHQDIPYILKTADCLILTGNESEIISEKYTSPLKMFEYMASGCPIVAQDLPSFREVLNIKKEDILNNENSFLVKPGDAKALADQIAWVFDDKNKELVEKIAEQAKEDVKNYTWQKRAERIVTYLGFSF